MIDGWVSHDRYIVRGRVVAFRYDGVVYHRDDNTFTEEPRVAIDWRYWRVASGINELVSRINAIGESNESARRRMIDNLAKAIVKWIAIKPTDAFLLPDFPPVVAYLEGGFWRLVGYYYGNRWGAVYWAKAYENRSFPHTIYVRNGTEYVMCSLDDALLFKLQARREINIIELIA